MFERLFYVWVVDDDNYDVLMADTALLGIARHKELVMFSGYRKRDEANRVRDILVNLTQRWYERYGASSVRKPYLEQDMSLFFVEYLGKNEDHIAKIVDVNGAPYALHTDFNSRSFEEVKARVDVLNRLADAWYDMEATYDKRVDVLKARIVHQGTPWIEDDEEKESEQMAGSAGSDDVYGDYVDEPGEIGQALERIVGLLKKQYDVVYKLTDLLSSVTREYEVPVLGDRPEGRIMLTKLGRELQDIENEIEINTLALNKLTENLEL